MYINIYIYIFFFGGRTCCGVPATNHHIAIKRCVARWLQAAVWQEHHTVPCTCAHPQNTCLTLLYIAPVALPVCEALQYIHVNIYTYIIFIIYTGSIYIFLSGAHVAAFLQQTITLLSQVLGWFLRLLSCFQLQNTHKATAAATLRPLGPFRPTSDITKFDPKKRREVPCFIAVRADLAAEPREY